MHAKDNGELANLETFRGPLGSITAFLAVVSGISVKIFRGSEAVQATEQGSGSRRSGATELALLILKLDIKTQISHRVVSVCRLAAFVALDAASQFAIKHLVKEAVALLVVALRVSRSA